MDTADKPSNSRITVDEDHEMQYWARELGVDEATLLDLVRRKGGELHRIRLELREIRRRG